MSSMLRLRKIIECFVSRKGAKNISSSNGRISTEAKIINKSDWQASQSSVFIRVHLWTQR